MKNHQKFGKCDLSVGLSESEELENNRVFNDHKRTFNLFDLKVIYIHCTKYQL